MKSSFIPPEARPPVNLELAREAWEVAAVLESNARRQSMARRRASDDTEKETSDDTPDDRAF